VGHWPGGTKLRKIFLFMMVSLDGYFEGKDHDLSWHNADNKEFQDFAIEQLGEIGTIIFGKTTYEMMASFWPTDLAKDDPITAELMTKTPKIVISHSLEKADWANTRLIKENVEEELKKLKSQPGKDLAVFGSSNLCLSLLKMGLLDELRIMINPIVIGEGTTLFAGLDEKLKLKLQDTRVFKSGNVLLTEEIG
jgi:dihydrofolate reductase